MNKDYILFNLKEAREELDKTILELETKADYGPGEFFVAIKHVYHHVNTAWNAREASSEAAEECSQSDFERWRQFPPPEEIYLGS